MIPHLDPLTKESCPRNNRVKQLLQIWRKTETAAKSESSEHPLETELKENRPRRQYPWSRTHTAFAFMGGFAFDNSADADKVPFPAGRSRLVLSPRGLSFLAKYHPEILPDISEETIKDKSKADSLTKGLTCFQATYFLAQSFSRLAYGLPLTVLELNTVSHCLCALLMYLLWWHKPFDVREPILISTADPVACKVCAAMCMRSGLGYWKPISMDPDDKPISGHYYAAILEFDFDMNIGQNEETGEAIAHLREGQDGGPSASSYSSDQTLQLTLDEPKNGLVMRYTSSWAPGENLPLVSVISSYCANEPCQIPTATLTLSAEDLKLCDLARQTIPNYPELKEAPSRWAESNEMGFVRDEIPNVPDAGLTRMLELGDVFFSPGSICLANSLYSGIHLLAWNGPFRTRAESILWRISAVSLGVPLGSMLLNVVMIFSLVFLFHRTKPSKEGRFRLREMFNLRMTLSEVLRDDTEIEHALDSISELRGWRRYLLVVPCTVVVVALVMCLSLAVTVSLVIGRPFVVVECFLALPYAPAAAFLTPDWTSYWPHVS
jgi:hypothetical protein